MKVINLLFLILPPQLRSSLRPWPLCIVYGSFQATLAELNTYNTDHLAPKIKYFLSYGKSLLTSSLKPHEGNITISFSNVKKPRLWKVVYFPKVPNRLNTVCARVQLQKLAVSMLLQGNLPLACLVYFSCLRKVILTCLHDLIMFLISLPTWQTHIQYIILVWALAIF